MAVRSIFVVNGGNDIPQLRDMQNPLVMACLFADWE